MHAWEHSEEKEEKDKYKEKDIEEKYEIQKEEKWAIKINVPEGLTSAREWYLT